MNELSQTKLARPMDKSQLGGDVNALNNLCNFLNSPVLATADSNLKQGETSAAEALGSTTPGHSDQAAQLAANPLISQPKLAAGLAAALPAQRAAPSNMNFDRLVLTGRMAIGKDFLASKIGASVEGFAVPLYHLAEHFFGVPVDANQNKGLPGMRQFLQMAGNWGRGHISAAYPVSPSRAVFVTAIRSLGAAGLLSRDLGVTWEDFGRDANLWLNAALVRISVANNKRVAVTGCRFANEFKRLTEEGFINWHCMASPAAWAERLAKRGVKPDDAVLKDESEKMAASLDAQVVKEISRSRNGPKLRVIWNSPEPVPSPRLWSVQDFLSAAGTPDVGALSDEIVLSGE